MDKSLAEVLLSTKIIDLPPKIYYGHMTEDQKQAFLSLKFIWTEYHAALNRYFCGLPIRSEYWDKRTEEVIMPELDKILTLYKLINFGWNEIHSHKAMEGYFSTPGQLFIFLLEMQSLAMLIPCFENFSFSPQIQHRALRKFLKGEGKPFATKGQLLFLEMQNFILHQILQKSKDRYVQKTLKEYRAACHEVTRVQLKWTNPAKKNVMGHKWVDGVKVPSARGVRHNPNPSEE